MKTCVIPGSFDPFTLGHLDVVERASKLFDKVYVAIMVNSDKNGTFSLAVRKKIAEVSCSELDNVTVITADGLLVDLCGALGASAIVKGIRGVSDFGYEEGMANINRRLSGIETVLLAARPELSFISSTFVRELLKYGRPIEGAVHVNAVQIIKSECLPR